MYIQKIYELTSTVPIQCMPSLTGEGLPIEKIRSGMGSRAEFDVHKLCGGGGVNAESEVSSYEKKQI